MDPVARKHPQLNGEQPTATYQPPPFPMILLPLGTSGGVGQLPSPDGPVGTPAAMVSEYKGADLFTGRFTKQFGPTAGRRGLPVRECPSPLLQPAAVAALESDTTHESRRRPG
ncbi:hypothetical protein [Saccharopolyspora sp. ASAGF58]|uniref:hypothetical protein n=1 Tax=Saccharopolyspora sp. ASAGF58 TaxID=2719023 RepID=UPI001B306103|nr:hypothetical protein [Saccharopolyspora sp. ASAGF58]